MVARLYLGHISRPAAVDRWGSVVSAKIPISVVIGQKIRNKSFPKRSPSRHRPIIERRLFTKEAGVVAGNGRTLAGHLLLIAYHRTIVNR